MNVWIDGLAFESKRQRGIWRVFYEMITRSNDRIKYTIWLQNEQALPLPEGTRIVRTEGRRELSRFNVSGRLERRWLRTNDPRAMADADLFHSTGFTWPRRESLPAALTLCDMIAESHFAICTREVQESLPIKREALYRAVGLHCISEATRKELTAFYPDLSHKSHVIHLGIRSPFTDVSGIHSVTDGHSPASGESIVSSGTQLRNNAESKKYAIYVGQRVGYKNFGVVLQAMTLPTWPLETNLVVVGPEFNFGEQLLIRRYDLENKVQHAGTISDVELFTLYSQARCLLFPSLQEGFGLPCLEAQAAGCPLVCSDIPVFHEVAGEAAIFFDPRIPESLANAVSKLGSHGAREQLLVAGERNAKRFDWDAFANEMVSWYSRLLNQQAKS